MLSMNLAVGPITGSPRVNLIRTLRIIDESAGNTALSAPRSVTRPRSALSSRRRPNRQFVMAITERPVIGFRAGAAKSSRCDRHHRTIRQGVRSSAAVEPQRIRGEKAMSNNRHSIAAAHVEPAAGGFATPNVFGPAHHYLSNEIQKAE